MRAPPPNRRARNAGAAPRPGLRRAARGAPLAILLAAGAAGCWAQAAQPGCEREAGDERPPVIGRVEYALVGQQSMRHKARIDTGARTSSVGIDSLRHFERDGAKWVQFTVKARRNDEVADFELPLLRTVAVKRINAKPQPRPVVRMRVAIGPISDRIEVTLNNRDDFNYPILVGRNFLDGRFVVDVAQKFIADEIEPL